MDKCRAGLRWCVIDLLTQQEGSLCPHQALHWIKFHECLSIEQLIGVSINAFQAYLYLFPGFVSFFSLSLSLCDWITRGETGKLFITMT